MLCCAPDPRQTRRALGISDTMIRLSVGIEDGDDLVHDVSNALEKIAV